MSLQGNMIVGDWLVEEQLNRLRRGSETVRLEPRSIEVLLVMARHPGEVLAKERLLKAVWGDQVISEEALTHAVWELRKALGDNARKPSYIQTIPKKGYRLIAAVSQPASQAPQPWSLLDAAGDAGGVPVQASEHEAGPGHPRPGRDRLMSRLWMPALVVATMLGYWSLDPPRQPDPGAAGLPRILVRPFEVSVAGREPSAEIRRFVAGVTSEITRRLVAFDGLAVVPHDTVRRYAGRSLDDVRAGGVADVVLDGQVHSQASDPDEIRLTAQLVDLGEDRVILSLDETGALAALPAIYTRVAMKVADKLGPTARLDAFRDYLDGLEWKSLPRFESAENAYRKGMELKSLVDYERDSISKAVDLFAHAVEELPTFAAAWAELAKAQAYLYFNGHADPEDLHYAKAALEQARRIEPNTAEVKIAESLVAYYGDQDFERALELLSGVAAERPDDAEVLRVLGYLQRRLGNLSRAVDFFSQALELEPRDSAVWSHLAETLRAQRRFEDAAAHYRQAMSLNPSDPVARGEAALNHFAMTGSVAEASAILAGYPHPQDKILYYRLPLDLYGRQFHKATLRFAEAPSFQEPIERFQNSWLAALAYQRLGRVDDARLLVDETRQFMEEQVGRSPAFAFFHGYLALTYAYLGWEEEARREIGLALDLARSDLFSGPRIREQQARVLALLGDLETSFALLEGLLDREYQHCLTRQEIHADPFWDPWRQDPSFPITARPQGTLRKSEPGKSSVESPILQERGSTTTPSTEEPENENEVSDQGSRGLDQQDQLL